MWFWYALAFALITSISTIIAKSVMQELDEYRYLWWTGLFTIPILLAIIVLFYQIPKIDLIFVLSSLAAIAIGAVAAIVAYRAIRISEISLISPISAFNPVFTTLISFIILGESLNPKSLIGILFICLGAYVLQVSKLKDNILTPIKSLFSDRGVQLSFLAYLLWAITPIFEKTAIYHTTPQVPPFVALVGLMGTNVVFGIFSLRRSPKQIYKIKKFIPTFLIIGILGGIGFTTAMTAFSQGQLGGVTAVFKLSIIFTVLLGWLFFKEHNIRDRLLGVTIMLIGVYLIT